MTEREILEMVLNLTEADANLVWPRAKELVTVHGVSVDIAFLAACKECGAEEAWASRVKA